MGIEYLGLDAVGWHVMTESWWDKLLAAFLLATIVIGCSYFVFLIIRRIIRKRRDKHQRSAVPNAIARFIEKLTADITRLVPAKPPKKDLKTFGAFLSSVSVPLSPCQIRLLSQWDVIVVDPLQPGVLDALAWDLSTAYILARLDVQNLTGSHAANDSKAVINSLDVLSQTLATSLKRQSDPHSYFRGILLTGFREHFSPAVLKKLQEYVNALGLDVWLELSPPEYLSTSECRDIDMTGIRGIVYRNGTIRPDGDRQNYFMMGEMRKVMRALAGQKPMGEATFAMWETVNDGVELAHDVVQRAYKWCNYNSAMLWIGPQSALTDAKVALKKCVSAEPLGALMWLKNDEIIAAQDRWRSNDKISLDSCGFEPLYKTLDSVIPNLSSRLSLLSPEHSLQAEYGGIRIEAQDWPLGSDHVLDNPFSVSADENDYTGIGCFQMGLDCTRKDIADLLEAQRKLRDLDLLDRIQKDELRQLASDFKKLDQTRALGQDGLAALKELIDLLTAATGSETDKLRIYSGLHSGFRTRQETQIWGMYDVEPTMDTMNLYISNKTHDRAATILHTFLSSRGYTRFQCFTAEMKWAKQQGTLSSTWGLCPRILADIEQLSPAETLLWLQRLSRAKNDDARDLSSKVSAYCRYQLMEVPSLLQLRELNSTGYLSGDVSAESLVMSRLSWYREQGCSLPDASLALSVFTDIDARLPGILMSGNTQALAQFEDVITKIIQKDRIDASADMLALAVFCAFRRVALNEIYLEVLDRNPRPNLDPVQASCFAENYALGARCDAYLDLTPMACGKILSDRFRAYFRKYQPPRRDEVFTELPTAYASMDIDLDPKGGHEELPLYYRFTFLGIFAVPALIDITLLTTIGRGLYLSTYMSNVDKNMTTTALMVSLLLVGGFGGWISSGGSYYLYAMAFPAMSMFVLTRFIAGLCVAVVGGVFALIGIGAASSFVSGVVFFAYLVMLTTYLMTLSALSVYQLPGFQFQSGRTVIMRSVPILFISPILTLWVHHDIIIYPCIMALFVGSLLLGARKVLSQWNNWYLKISCITDTDLVTWYMKTHASPSDDIKDIGSTSVPRDTLLAEVQKERKRWFWQKATTDALVKKLADGYEATSFLLVWYCKFSRTNMPLPYSPTWNLQLKAAVDTMGDMQKGLKLHNAFLHWRHTGSDVLGGILYFIVALIDKWTALFTGEALVGLSNASSADYRLAVGFGLGYYLIGAVMLDGVSQPLWTASHQTLPQPISTLQSLREATTSDRRARRALYWKNLGKFFFLHIWGVAITCAAMWTFQSSRSATIMFIAYIGAYSGLLWYQYNRIFTGYRSDVALALGAVVGFVAGILLHKLATSFAYGGIVGLAAGTWTTALASFWRANVGFPFLSRDKQEEKSQTRTATYTFSAVEPAPEFSQTTLSQIFDTICELPADARYKLNPSTHPGIEVMQILRSPTRAKHVKAAFRSAEQILRRTAEMWERGETLVELVSAGHLMPQEENVRAITRKEGRNLHVFVLTSLDLVGDEWVINVRRNCKAIAEAIVQATAENRMDMSREHANLAELLVVSSNPNGKLSLPEGVKRQLECCPADRARIITQGHKQELRHVLFGVDSDIEWDKLPKAIRSFLVDRCCGNPCELSETQLSWIREKMPATDEQKSIDQWIARSNLGVSLAGLVASYARSLEERDVFGQRLPFPDSSFDQLIRTLDPPSTRRTDLKFSEYVKLFVTRSLRKLHACVKFTILALVADPEYQRELEYMTRGLPVVIAWPVKFFLTGIWTVCKNVQDLVLPLVLLHGREKVSLLYKNMQSQKTVIEKHRIVIDSLHGPVTCFTQTDSDGSLRLSQYSGLHEQRPDDAKLVAINTYTNRLRLIGREEHNGKSVPARTFIYDYSEQNRSKFPIQRRCVQGDLEGEIVQYDSKGHVTSGSAMRGVNPVQFQYWYRKNAKFDDELLRAEYTLPHIRIKVAWSMPPSSNPEKLHRWLPYPRVTEAMFYQDEDVYSSQWTYDHKFHPRISTQLNGEPVTTPPMIHEDWFNVLEKPTRCSFPNENPLLAFSSVKTNFFSRWLGLNVKRYPIPTSRARTQLWKSWKSSKEFDAITATWLDETLLRSDKVLKPYWRRREMGLLKSAGDYLEAMADTVLARVDIDPEVSSWTPLAYKLSDLYSFGQGGDARINTRTLSTQLQDDGSNLNVLAMDTGTWPNEPGGVSACRRDLVNDLKNIRWHIMAEAANDFGVPKFQIERNVQSLTVLPQWGLDFLNPTHGVFQSFLDSEVVERSHATSAADIQKNFIPILTSLVQCARAVKVTRQHIEQATKALVDLNTYFETTRSWNDVWMSDIVKKAWRELWLADDIPNAIPVSQWLDTELPTLHQLDNALDMWHRYLFIFSVPVPERIPDIFQASHHFTGATYGVLCKVKRKCALHVWDHCVSFREMTTFLSSAVSFDSTFVNSTLISLGHLACILLQHHADVVLPCAEYFNPGWEIELGTCEGALQHRRTFKRKIDPVVNGITNMERYKPIEEIKTKTPTVVMLSHIRYVKDIKTAIMATDQIVNIWGFKDYCLHIYGDMERAPAYASECQEVIASKGLRDHVVLKGLGNPSVVLQDAWLFMNSSISEGLPLAMGEAALTGVPVVCTDVGASFCVVTDRATGGRFSEVVAPNDAFSLASAQIRVLALLGQWSPFASDPEGYIPPTLALRLSPEEVKRISDRMYEKADKRRQLGMLGRNNVLNNFSSDRYLREHEQMLWLGKYQSRSYVARGSGPVSSNSSGVFRKKWKSSILVEQTELPVSEWARLRQMLGNRGSRRNSIAVSSGTQTPV